MASQAASFDIEQAGVIALSAQSIITPIIGFLSGVVLLLYISYISGTSEEPASLKFLASAVVLAVLIDFGLGIAALREYSLNSLKDPTSSTRLLKVNIGQIVTLLVILTSTQLYFGRVVYAATGSSKFWLVTAVILITATQGGVIGSIWVYADQIANGIPEATSARGQKQIVLYLVGAGAASVFDLLVSVVLCRTFFSSKRRAFFGNTKDVLTTLLVTTLETFSLTATTAMTVAVLSMLSLRVTGMPAWKVRVGIISMPSIISRVYAVSLLYTLNRRAPLRQRLNHPSAGFPNPSDGARNQHFETLLLEGVKGISGVRVQTDVLYTSDEMDTVGCEKKPRPPVASNTSSGGAQQLPSKHADASLY